MGLRAASVRHSDATVMAPALTEANQSDNFKLAASNNLELSKECVPVNGHSHSGCSPVVVVGDEGSIHTDRLMCKELVTDTSSSPSSSMVTAKKSHSSSPSSVLLNNVSNCYNTVSDALDNLNTLALVSEIVKVNNGHIIQHNSSNNTIASGTSSLLSSKEVMNEQSSEPQQLSMADDKSTVQQQLQPSQESEPQSTVTTTILSSTMGLQSIAQQKEMTQLVGKEKQQSTVANNDVELLLMATASGTVEELPTNVEDFMQVLKTMESADTVTSSQSSVAETEPAVVGDTEMTFPISTVNLTNFCQNLLNDVDVLNYSETVEEQIVVDQDAIVNAKEAITQDRLAELKRTQMKLERRYEFLLRRLEKIQARGIAQHVSGEVAGLFEMIHKVLKRSKDKNSSILHGLTSTPTIPENNVSEVDDYRSLQFNSFTIPPPTPISSNINTTTWNSEKCRGLSFTSVKNLVHKLEKTKVTQTSALYRNKSNFKYFGSGSTTSETLNLPSTSDKITKNNFINIPPLANEPRHELERVAGLLKTEVEIVQHQIDSDATASSSGAESCDEMQSFTNPHQQFCTISRRASWKFAQERAAIATRWTWVQWQISDLEYRIRQLNELHKQIRNSKGPVVFGNISTRSAVVVAAAAAVQANNSCSPPSSVNGYRGLLSSAIGKTSANSNIIDDVYLHSSTSGGVGSNSSVCSPNNSCSRTKPFVKSVFRNRRLLQTTGLHVISKKWRPSSVRCNCVPGMPPCALCTGRTDPTYPKESKDLTTTYQQIGYLDAGYHPKISFQEDINQSFHYDALLKIPEWQQKTARNMTKALKLAVKSSTSSDRIQKNSDIRIDGAGGRVKKPEYRRKYNKLLKASTANALSAKIKNRLARGRKPNRIKTQAALMARMIRKKPPAADVALAQLQALSGTDDLDGNGSSGTTLSGIVAAGLGNDMDDYEMNIGGLSDSKHPSPASSPPLLVPERVSFNRSDFNRRSRVDSYDIDNIVIPYSVAASTRVEKLPYKEILTPKWRVIDVESYANLDTQNNGFDPENDEEDVSDDAVIARHDKCELDEKKKFMSYIKFPLTGSRSRTNRRTDSRAESSGANTPDPMSPHALDIVNEASNSPLTSPPATPMPTNNNNNSNSGMDDYILHHSISTLRRRTISQSKWMRGSDRSENRGDDVVRCITPDHHNIEVIPYDDREFPLTDDVYMTMLSVMPEGHPIRAEGSKIDDIHQQHHEQQNVTGNTFSPMLMDTESSNDSVLGEEDPNDPEWMIVKRIRDRPKR